MRSKRLFQHCRGTFSDRFHWSRARCGLVTASLVVLTMALVLLVPPGFAQPSPGPDPTAARLTQEFVALTARYLRANATEQAQLLGELVDLVTTRQQLLATLVESDPGAVLRLAVPATLRASLPLAVQALIEEEVELEGVLEVLHEDRDIGSRYLYFLEAVGQRFALHFAADPPTLPTGTQVRVQGVRVGGALALDSSTSVQTLTVILPHTFGEQPTLVILVTFQDNPTWPYTVAYAQSVFNTTSEFFWENSYQQTWLTGMLDDTQAADVRGWYTIALASTVCDSSTLASQAKAAAQANGVNLAVYRRYVYAFPKNACTWWGLGTVGGNPSQVWINGSLQLRVVAHELGHAVGLYHSRSLSCDTAGCTASEYGDGWDNMGGAVGHFNAFQKERLGWLNYGASPPLIPVTADGTYWLEAYVPDSTHPKALKLWKSTDSRTGKKTYYYVEYRTRVGFDSNLPRSILLHTGSEASANSSYLWDLAPTTTTSDWGLDVGQSYTDDDAGVTLTTVLADSTGATIQVRFGRVPCVETNPTVALAPTSLWVIGTTGTYTVTVTNTDSSSCVAAKFELSAVVPSGWTPTLASATLLLSPGESGATTLTLTAPAATPDGFYPFTVTATNSPYVGSASSVEACCSGTLAVKVTTDKSSYPQNAWVTIAVTVHIGQTPCSGTNVALTLQRSDAQVATLRGITDSTGSLVLKYKLEARADPGAYQLLAVATANEYTGNNNTAVFQVVRKK